MIMESRLAVVALSLLLMLALLPSGEAAKEDTVCAAFFYEEGTKAAEVVLPAIQSLADNYSFFNVQSYDIWDHYDLYHTMLSAYNASDKPPLLFVGNEYYHLNPESQNFDAVLAELEKSIQDFASLGNIPCPVDEKGNVIFPRPVCILLFYDFATEKDAVSPYVTALQDTITYISLYRFDTHHPSNISRLENFTDMVGPDLYSPVLIMGNQSYTLANVSVGDVVNEAKRLSKTGVECPEVESDREICIVYFGDPSCHLCGEAKEELKRLEVLYPQLNVSYHNSDHEYDLLFRYLNNTNGSDDYLGPFYIFIGDRLFGEGQFEELEEYIKQHVDTGLDCPQPGSAGIKKEFEELTLVAIVAAGLLDGINPCAFATLIFFIAYLERIKQSKRALVTIGMSFSAAVFIGYFLIGLGLIHLYGTIEDAGVNSDYIYLFAGFFALILATFNLFDYFRIGQDEKTVLQLPRFLKRRRGRIIRVLTKKTGITLLAILAFLTGIGIAFLELPCTGQIYLVIVAAVRSTAIHWTDSIPLLILYNLMFILPLIIILGLFYKGFTSQKLGEIQKKRQGLIKLLTALVLAIVGSYMLYMVLW